MPKNPRALRASVVTTFAATLALASLADAGEVDTSHCRDDAFPAQWVWADGVPVSRQPRPAVDADGLKPLVKQIRNGKVIATYTSLGGTPQGSAHYDPKRPDTSGGALKRMPHQNYESGDIFEVYPAVYRGEDQQPYIGPMVPDFAAYEAKAWYIPRNITIRGVTVNGVRPVIRLDGIVAGNNTLGQSAIYIDKSENVTIENIDVDGTGTKFVGKAGVFLQESKNLTLRNMRIHGFKGVRQNGLFVTDGGSGTLTLENLELFDNGGDNGPEHNVYVNPSKSDPNFKVILRGSVSTDAYYGHLFKSRAQVNLIEGNYLAGTRSQKGQPQTEAFLLDFPEGGRVTVRNNVMVKTYSGLNSNGGFMTYATEKFDRRPHALQVEHNTMVAFSHYYDPLRHPLFPFYLKHGNPMKAAPSFPVEITRNVFVGFCPERGNELFYFGSDFLAPGFAELNHDFTLRSRPQAAKSDIVGTPAYRFLTGTAPRTSPTYGARD